VAGFIAGAYLRGLSFRSNQPQGPLPSRQKVTRSNVRTAGSAKRFGGFTVFAARQADGWVQCPVCNAFRAQVPASACSEMGHRDDHCPRSGDTLLGGLRAWTACS
jgi:hypothetical protein